MHGYLPAHMEPTLLECVAVAAPGLEEITARELQGLERLDQIKYAVVEESGHITVVPKRGDS